MRRTHSSFLLAVLLCLSFCSLAQKHKTPVYLASGTIYPASNIQIDSIERFNSNAFRHGNTFVIIQFDVIPTEEIRKELATQGIELLSYIPDNAFTAVVRKKIVYGVLQKARARAIIEPAPQQKMQKDLSKGAIPAEAVKIKGTVNVTISFPKSLSTQEVIATLKAANFEIISQDKLSYHLLDIQLPVARLKELAALSVVEYVQPAFNEAAPLNEVSRGTSRANVLNTSLADGGKGLNGEGVVVGVGDNANVQDHIDFNGRLLSFSAANAESHGTHVTGIVGGAGIIDETTKGYASKATIINEDFTDIINYAPAYVQDYGMVITNNSYKIVGNGCGTHGFYDLNSGFMDQQSIDLPNLQHVFAAGNDGGWTCGFPTGFGTIAGALQTSKNSIAVGNTYNWGVIYPGSSKGPVIDGRLKPEIVANGTSVYSTYPYNSYGYYIGTSQSAPAVAGGLALLYQRHKQLHGAVPKAALMKALLCNGSTDLGNKGPDYTFGFGWMNLLRSVDMLEQGNFRSGFVSNGSSESHTITIPANTAQLKVMLYWHDPAGSPLSARALVNDLDLRVQDPVATDVLPQILNPSNVTAASVQGVDRLNNIEQVVIDNPAAGNYTINVSGWAIAQNPTQEYFIVYDVIPVSLQVTYPAGGESLVPGQAVRIQWDSYGDASSTFTLQYSVDGGANWLDINTSIAAGSRFYDWTLPATSTDNAMIRVIKNATGASDAGNSFTVIGRPVISLGGAECPGYISVQWSAIADATDYEVMVLKGDEMHPVATTTSTSYTLSGLSIDSTYWISVRARINGNAGLRSGALARQPNTGSCEGTVSDNDLKLEAILSPTSGRAATSSALAVNHPVVIQVRNLDDATTGSFVVKYSIDGGVNWISETVTTPLGAQNVYTHTFSTTANLSAIGAYQFIAAVENLDPDPVTNNNTLATSIKHLNNVVLDLSSVFLDKLETAAVGSYLKDTIGLTNLDRYDFINTTANGRLRTFVSSELIASGNRALTLDADRAIAVPNTNYLTGTYNLSNYDANTSEMRLGFLYNYHGQVANPANRVWIRGNDNSTTPWIEVYDLDANRAPDGIYKNVSSIELSDLLLANGQNFSSSFQVRWGQSGQNHTIDRNNASGYTIDDIRLLRVQNDMELVSINNLPPVSCGLSATTSISIAVKNTMNTTATDVPVRYRFNNGPWISDIIPTIPPNTTITHAFSNTANLSAFGPYTIDALVDLSTDSYRANDTVHNTFTNTALITAFPYLQNFEADNGNWYTGGANSSWEWGTPASVNINKAANGSKAWKTRLAGNYNDNETSFLYSPCYDISGMANPTLSFSVALDLEDCGGSFCDGVIVQYSTDGVNWQKLGASATGTNWYNKGGSQELWSIQNYTNWHVATTALPTGHNQLRLRFVLSSDGGVTREGIAIDDIHIYDRPVGIYNGGTMAAPTQQTINGGTGWVDFTEGGALVASIQPNGQIMGQTAIQAFIAGAVRNVNNQYYHNRNLTIKPANKDLLGPVKVRFYFTEAEMRSLIAATGCGTCTKPFSAYELGLSKFTHADLSKENGDVSDNNGGNWKFIPPGAVTIVPFDIGYYAEFEVTDFSEFWLNNGGLDGATPLPVKLISFTGQRVGNDAQLQWQVSDELNVLQYELEVARNTEDLQAGRFSKIGQVASRGNSTSIQQYRFTDTEPNKKGMYYYRLKMVDKNASFTYSSVRPVVFADPITWQVYPNPSAGLFHLTYQLNTAEQLTAQLFDNKGRLMQQYTKEGSGSWQKFTIDLSNKIYASGVYLLKVSIGEQQRSFKLYKQ
jgi:hypothetical protein